MAQFYAKDEDEKRCLESSVDRQPILITGLTREGVIRAFTGTVRSVEIGHTAYAAYPLRVTMPDAN